jgi:hypothetical protein
MAAAFWIALQAAAAPMPVPPDVVPIDFDLSRVGRSLAGPIAVRRCAPGDAETIIVCGRRSEGGYPLAEWALVFPPEGPLRAETGLGGGVTGRIHTEAVALDRGAVSNRAMIGISTAF